MAGIFRLDMVPQEAANFLCMKLMSYSTLALAGAVCLAFANVASADDNPSSKPAVTKSANPGKSTIPEIVTPTKDDVVVWVKVTGSLIPQRYVIRNGQILSTSTNTALLLTNSASAAGYVNVQGIILQNIPDASLRRR